MRKNFAKILRNFCEIFAHFLRKICKIFAKNAQNFFKKRKELEFANLSFNSLLQIINRYSKIDSNLTSAMVAQW